MIVNLLEGVGEQLNHQLFTNFKSVMVIYGNRTVASLWRWMMFQVLALRQSEV